MVWAQQTVPSSVAALIISIEPLWFVIFDWLFFKSRKPTVAETLGVILGFGGTVFLVLDQAGYSLSLSGTHTVGMLIVLAATVNWSMGALYSRRAPVAKSSLLSTAMQMSAGDTAARSIVSRGRTGTDLPGRHIPKVRRRPCLPGPLRLTHGVHGLHLAAEGGPRLTGDHSYVRESSGGHIPRMEHRGRNHLRSHACRGNGDHFLGDPHHPEPSLRRLRSRRAAKRVSSKSRYMGTPRSTWDTTSDGVSSAAASPMRRIIHGRRRTTESRETIPRRSSARRRSGT